jgi:hypothetical protein
MAPRNAPTWKRGFNLFALIVSSLIAALTIATMVAIVTELGEFAGETDDVVRVLNDSPRVVTIRLCRNDDCSNGFHPPRSTLEPGETAYVGVSTTGVPNVYLVLAKSDERIGCLPLVMPKPVKGGLEVGVSAAVSCRKGLDEDVQWPAP